MAKTSLDKSKIKILLLEGVHQSAVDNFLNAGYTNIEHMPTSLDEESLIEKIRDVHFIGIRSRTQLTERVFAAAEKLVAVGCFCIGTNQVDLTAALVRGIPVFNAPYSNTRSVAELVLAEAIMLLRGIPEKNARAHQGGWLKSAKNSHEARGSVVVIEALAEAIKEGRLNGAAIDVFPVEPKGNADEFESPLRGLENVILTPHIGGSTLEAQENIGVEVSEKLVTFSDNGTSITSVNFPEVALPAHPDKHRLLHIHENVPGVMSEINRVLSENDINISGQYLQTNEKVGYVVIDVDKAYGPQALEALREVNHTLRTRVLYSETNYAD
jgi:phosphoglycerate dehydrogenase-like enzyme